LLEHLTVIIPTLVLSTTLALAQEPLNCIGLTPQSDANLVSQCRAAAETAWAKTKKEDTVGAYRQYRTTHPGSAHQAESIEQEAAAALRDTQKLDTPEMWRALRKHYPVHTRLSQERELKSVAKAIGETAELHVPCERPEPTEEVKKPKPTCEFLEAEKVIRLSWKTPDGYHARPRLVGWDGKKVVSLTSLQRLIGAAPYASEYAAIVQAAKGGMDETGWRVELPVELRLPPGHGLIGYAVELKVMGETAKVLPFIITEEWADTRVRTR
jgi:hypothetical protein